METQAVCRLKLQYFFQGAIPVQSDVLLGLLPFKDSVQWNAAFALWWMFAERMQEKMSKSFEKCKFKNSSEVLGSFDIIIKRSYS